MAESASRSCVVVTSADDEALYRSIVALDGSACLIISNIYLL